MKISLLYIASQRLPTEKAYGLQIAKMCEAFGGAGVSLELLVATRRNSVARQIFEYYGIREAFKVTSMQTLDFYLPGVLDRVAFFVKQWISAIKLVRLAVSLGTDIIYSRDELPIYLASFYAKHPTLIFEAHKFSGRRRWYYQRFRKVGVKIVVISKGIKDRFVELGYPPEMVLVAHDGVDVGQFATNKTVVECRELLGLPQGKKIVLYAGHLYEWKGAHILAEAAKSLDDRCVVVFVGGTERDIDQYKKRYSNRVNLLFLGWQPHKEIPLYLKAADLLVLPNSGKEEISRIYTSPLKLFEYMASGKPIVASDLPSIREILTEETAFFARPDNPESLTAVINEVISNTSEGEERAKRALLESARYSWKARARTIMQFIGYT